MLRSRELTEPYNTIASGTVRMPGTCGEFVQGAIDGITFHVSCPIDVFSTVTVHLTDATDEWTIPAGFPKAGAAAQAALCHFAASSLGGSLKVESHLPRAKGMASSTADVAGAIYAVALALGREIAPAEAAKLALQIEPTDGSIFPNVALFDHRRGTLYEDLGPAPALGIIVLDFGGEVDTVEFNRQDRTDILARLSPSSGEALELARKGLRTGDLSLLGKAATMSAIANQAILYKPHLDRVLRIAEQVGAVGVNVGHSGTVIGVLLDRSPREAADAAAHLAKELTELHHLQICQVIGGGCRQERSRR